MFVRAALTLSFAATCTAAIAQSAPTLIRGVAVFDGERSLGKRSVLIDGGRIADVDYRGKPTAATRIVEGGGKTLLPGLIDAHVHAFQSQDDPLLFGVTTQLDMFAAPAMIRDVRARMANGTNATAADLFSAGILATAPKGHGTQFGFPIPTLTNPQEADAWVAARLAEGSDYIKIIDEPGSATRPLATLDPATIKALIVATHKRGKLAVVHAQSLDAATRAIDAGADGLVHLFTDKDGGAAFAALAKARGAFIIPTYAVLEVFHGRSGTAGLLNHPSLSGMLARSAVANVRQTMGPDRSAKLDATEAANIAALSKAGVPILAGTDSGNPGLWYGLSMHRELDLLVKAGLTSVQALTAATAAPAKAFRLSDRGRIAKGLKADLLLVEGDPTTDIAAAHAIVEVWKDGQSANALRAARRTAIAATPAALPAATLPADGRIATFSSADGKAVMKAPFGAGWTISTDSFVGGTSTVALIVTGTAPNGQPALVMTGEIKPGAIASWAGVSFSPAAQPFQPANLGAANAIRFWTRGEGSALVVMGFSQAGGQAPSVASVQAGKDWREVTVKFSDLKGFDPTGATLLLIGASQVPGQFRYEIADVRLVRV